MKVHANAPLGPKGRLTMVRRVLEPGWSLTPAAEAAGVSERTCSKWVDRYRAEGEAGLLDRSSAPRSIPHRTPDELVEVIVLLRRLRMTGAEIAFFLRWRCRPSRRCCTGRAGQARRLEPLEPPNRYERRHPGELMHVDVKKLGRIPTGGPGTASTASAATPAQARRRRPRPRRSAGSSCTSASTTPPAWPTSRSCPTRRPPPRSASSPRDRVLPPPRHHRRARDDRQRLRPTARPSTPSPAARSACGTCAPGPTGPAPTARPNASSAPCSPAGPTARFTAQAETPQPLTAGSGPTTIADTPP